MLFRLLVVSRGFLFRLRLLVTLVEERGDVGVVEELPELEEGFLLLGGSVGLGEEEEEGDDVLDTGRFGGVRVDDARQQFVELVRVEDLLLESVQMVVSVSQSILVHLVLQDLEHQSLGGRVFEVLLGLAGQVLDLLS